MLASAFGNGLADRPEAAQGPVLPETLRGVSVTLRPASGGEGIRARLLFVSPAQVNFLVPDAVADGVVTAIVTGSDGRTSETKAPVERSAPGLFHFAWQDKEYPMALMTRVRADGTQSVRPLQAARAEDAALSPVPVEAGETGDRFFLSLFGTGIRNLNPENVTVFAGTFGLPVQFSGPQGSPGLDQINVEITSVLNAEGKTVQLKVMNSATPMTESNTVEILLRP